VAPRRPDPTTTDSAASEAVGRDRASGSSSGAGRRLRARAAVRRLAAVVHPERRPLDAGNRGVGDAARCILRSRQEGSPDAAVARSQLRQSRPRGAAADGSRERREARGNRRQSQARSPVRTRRRVGDMPATRSGNRRRKRATPASPSARKRADGGRKRLGHGARGRDARRRQARGRPFDRASGPRSCPFKDSSRGQQQTSPPIRPEVEEVDEDVVVE